MAIVLSYRGITEDFATTYSVLCKHKNIVLLPVPSGWRWKYLCLQYNEKAYSSSHTHKEKDSWSLHGFFGKEGTELPLHVVWAGMHCRMKCRALAWKFIAAVRRNSRGVVFFHLEVAVHSVKQWKHKVQFQSPFLPLPSITQNFIPQKAPSPSIAVWVSKTKQCLYSRDDQDGNELLLVSKQRSLIWREIALSRNVLFPNLTNLHKSIYLSFALALTLAFSDTEDPTSKGRGGSWARGEMLSAIFKYWEMWELTSVSDTSSQSVTHRAVLCGTQQGNVLWYRNSWLQIWLENTSERKPVLSWILFSS